MYHKLTLLISVVCLFGLAAGASAEEVVVPWPDCWIIDDVVVVESIRIEGCVIVESTGVLIVTGGGDRSSIDGDGGDGPGGSEYASLTVNGGVVNVHSRLNMGQDHDAYIIINDGGLVTQECCGNDWEDGLKFPDDSGGVHRIIINDGTLHAFTVEQKATRDAQMELGCGGYLIMDYTRTSQDYCPTDWETNGDLYCSASAYCIGPFYEGECGDPMEVYCWPHWPPPPLFCPEDESTAVPVDVCLTWPGGGTMGGHPGDKHYVFFGTDEACVTNGIIGDDCYRGFKPVGLEEYCPPGDLDLWTTYFWRIDQKPFGEPTFKGHVRSFTAGCEMAPGDINLDCVVDGTDYAMLADDWMVTSFFPDDF